MEPQKKVRRIKLIPWTIVAVMLAIVSALATSTLTAEAGKTAHVVRQLALLKQFDKEAQAVEYQKKLPQYHVLMVGSYHTNHICMVPQMYGVRTGLEALTDKYHVILRTACLKARTTNKNPHDLKAVVARVRQDIKVSNPDILVTVDDVAFRDVGIPAINEGRRVYFTGLNKPFKDYQRYIDGKFLRNVSGVQETIILDNFLKLLNAAEYDPAQYYIIADDTITSQAMKNDYVRELSTKTTKKFQVFQIDDILDLRQLLENLQSKPKGVIVLAFQAIRDEDGERLTKQDPIIMQAFRDFNHKHLELGGNNIFGKLGVSVCTSPDFQEMGSLMATMIEDDVRNPEGITHRVKSAYNQISVNTARLNDLGFHTIVSTAENTLLVPKVYTTY